MNNFFRMVGLGLVFIVALALICAITFGFWWLVAWAFCYIVSLFGVTLVVSWKLVLALVIISMMFGGIRVKVDKN